MRKETLSPAEHSAGYPVFAVDCDGLVANRFALVHAAAARARQLNRGEAPRVEVPWAKSPQIAVAELAAGAFSPSEVEALLGLDRPAGETGAIELDRPDSAAPEDELRLLDAMSRDAAALTGRREERLDTLA